jgi:hypothetical protein
MGNVHVEYSVLPPDAILDLRPHDVETMNREYTTAVYHINSARSPGDFALSVDGIGKLFERYPTTLTCFKSVEGVDTRFAAEGHLDIIAAKFEKFMQETDPDVRIPRAILSAASKMLRSPAMRRPFVISTIPKTSMSVVAKFQDETLARDTAILIANKLGSEIINLEKDRARSFALIILATLRLYHSDESLIGACLPVVKQYSFFFDIVNDADLIYDSMDSILPTLSSSSVLLEQAFDVLHVALMRRPNFSEQNVKIAEQVLTMLKNGSSDDRCYTAVLRWLCLSGLNPEDIAVKVIDQKIKGVGSLIREVYQDEKQAFRHANLLIVLARDENMRSECRKNLEAVEMVELALAYSTKQDVAAVLDRYSQLLQVLNKIK